MGYLKRFNVSDIDHFNAWLRYGIIKCWGRLDGVRRIVDSSQL